MRIAHVVGTREFAGLERYVVEVATEQRARGHDVQVLGGAPAVVPGLLAGSAVRWAPGGTTREMLRSLAGAGRRDVVHSHLTKADFCASATSVLTQGALVSTRHITAPRGYGRVARGLAPLVRRRLALEIAVSAWTSGQLEAPADAVLLNGVRSAAPAVGGGERVVLVAQRLAPEKDTTTALRAWARSGLGERGWTLQVAGAGPERAELERTAASLGVQGSVTFLGWVDDVDAAFRRAAVLLAPAPTEPCGLAILEAMAVGLPVVAAGSGGNAETIGSIQGAAVFPAGDATAAAELLRRLADDDAARRRYGQSLLDAQRRRFSLQGHVDQLEVLYTRALGRRRHSGDRRGTADDGRGEPA